VRDSIPYAEAGRRAEARDYIFTYGILVITHVADVLVLGEWVRKVKTSGNAFLAVPVFTGQTSTVQNE
jgi:hypothetical protein